MYMYQLIRGVIWLLVFTSWSGAKFLILLAFTNLYVRISEH